MKTFQNTIYLNANIILSHSIANIKGKRANTIDKIKKNYPYLATSILTRFEFIQNLVKMNFTKKQAMEIYTDILRTFGILEITSLNKMNLLNNAFIDKFSSSKIDFKDCLHIEIAKKMDMIVCTHDKKMANHSHKKEIYEKVFKPEELIF